MRTVALSILLAASAALACPAHAQEAASDMPGTPSVPEYSAPTDSGWEDDRWRDDFGPVKIVNPFRAGFAALDAEDFATAEKIFARYVRRDQGNAVANFFLGAARMDLGKWEAAKKPLKIAVRKKPNHPDPKSRLGVTYAKLDDIAAANAQRAELVKMADACKGACELSPLIMDGIQMIDEALVEPVATPAPQG
jgi:TolA-binding protein